MAILMPWTNFMKWPQTGAKKTLLLLREGCLKLILQRALGLDKIKTPVFSNVYPNQVICDSVLEFWGWELDIVLLGNWLLLRLFLNIDDIKLCNFYCGQKLINIISCEFFLKRYLRDILHPFLLRAYLNLL